MSKIKCNECEELKVRIFSGKMTGNRRINVDEHGKTWYGRVCPDCRSDKVKPPSKTRYCAKDRGGCGAKLDATRYFLCVECNPELSQIEGDEVYITW